MGNYDLPELEGCVEIKVDYGGLNFADLYTRQGLMLNKKLPFVLGMECTGTVTAVGTKTDLEVSSCVVLQLGIMLDLFFIHFVVLSGRTKSNLLRSQWRHVSRYNTCKARKVLSITRLHRFQSRGVNLCKLLNSILRPNWFGKFEGA